MSQKYQAYNYADDLKKQIEDFKDREKRKYNEMSDREKLINTKSINAYEIMDNDIHNRLLPGYSKQEERDNFKRFRRKGIP